MGPHLAGQLPTEILVWANVAPATLLMAVNGPSTVPENCCRWPQMGPTLLLGSAADGREWAQHRP